MRLTLRKELQKYAKLGYKFRSTETNEIYYTVGDIITHILEIEYLIYSSADEKEERKILSEDVLQSPSLIHGSVMSIQLKSGRWLTMPFRRI